MNAFEPYYYRMNAFEPYIDTNMKGLNCAQISKKLSDLGGGSIATGGKGMVGGIERIKKFNSFK